MRFDRDQDIGASSDPRWIAWILAWGFVSGAASGRAGMTRAAVWTHGGLPPMRRILFGLIALLGASGLASEARAQVPFTNLNDPLFAYYSFYLPRQQAQAAQPGPEATIAAITAQRQAYAATNRNDMFDTGAISPGLGGDSGDFAPNSGVRRSGGSRVSRIGGNLNGLGPAGYYNNARQYHPTIRPGISRNNNVAVIRGRSTIGGGVGGLGLPGPR